MIRDLKGTVEDKIPVKNVIASVFYKHGLLEFAQGLIEVNPEVRFISSGGTYNKLKDEIPGNVIEAAEYTGFPEMEGGLVKTLHPKIHAGLLGERNNPAHQEYLKEMNANYIDLMIGNLYPFADIISQEGVSFEKARGNIDIGGPAMTRAAAKNFPSCATICDPGDYQRVLKGIQENDGCTTFEQRLGLAAKVFNMTADYDRTIADFMLREVGDNMQKIKATYTFAKRGK